MIGTNGSNLQDNVTNTFSKPTSWEDDFSIENDLHLISRDYVPTIGRSDFSSKDGSYWVEQSIIPSSDRSYLILHYRIVNQSGGTLDGVHAGFFADIFLEIKPTTTQSGMLLQIP